MLTYTKTNLTKKNSCDEKSDDSELAALWLNETAVSPAQASDLPRRDGSTSQCPIIRISLANDAQ